MKNTAAIITVSDRCSSGERIDESGPALVKMLKDAGYEVLYTSIVPDERDKIRSELLRLSNDMKIGLLLTTGGTGFSQRDITPEATLDVIERSAPGLAELMRLESMKLTPNGCLSRGVAGIRKKTLIINLPGSKKGATENLSFILKPLRHGLDMLYTEGSADCGVP